MASSRRRGVESSQTRALLLDAAEKLMAEEGYPAVTTRRLSARVGVSNQLVHYYFRTMDDLFVSLIRRRAEINLRRLMQALTADNPLRAIWQLNSDPNVAGLAVEIMALTNHRKTVGKEVARQSEQLRALMTEALARILTDHGVKPEQYSPICLAILFDTLPRNLKIETALNVSMGHEEMTQLVERFFGRFDRTRRPTSRARKHQGP
jgi:TetR/AcrR family transcriptional regulator of autoinduction and epiphytic fitness